MPNREELKALIELMPDDKLGQVQQMLQFHLNPPEPAPEVQRMQRRSMEYQREVFKQFQEKQKPGTLGIGGGTGFTAIHEGMPFSRQGFHYWDEKALVHQSLQSFDGQEIEVMERLSFSAEHRFLVCALELSSGGHTVQHQDEFPISRPANK